QASVGQAGRRPGNRLVPTRASASLAYRVCRRAGAGRNPATTSIPTPSGCDSIPDRTFVREGLTSIRLFDNFGNMKKTEAIAALSALAHEARLDVFRFLVQQGPDGVPAGEIGERFGLPAATLSFHLSTLRHA